MQEMNMDVQFESQTPNSELQTSVWFAEHGTADLTEGSVLAAFRDEFGLTTADELL